MIWFLSQDENVPELPLSASMQELQKADKIVVQQLGGLKEACCCNFCDYEGNEKDSGYKMLVSDTGN